MRELVTLNYAEILLPLCLLSFEDMRRQSSVIQEKGPTRHKICQRFDLELLSF